MHPVAALSGFSLKIECGGPRADFHRPVLFLKLHGFHAVEVQNDAFAEHQSVTGCPIAAHRIRNIIGIQKALGAKKFFILQQFLVESMLLSIIGGLLGVLMIFIGTLVINYLYELNMYLTLSNMFLAVFISGIIGVVAGYAPANTAAKMNPVEAIGFSF